MQKNGRIVQPGQVGVEFQHVATPLAQPASFSTQAPDGVKVVAFGGLTKLEMLAGQIAGHLTAIVDWGGIEPKFTADSTHENPLLDVEQEKTAQVLLRMVAMRATQLAHYTLEHCAGVQQQQAPPPKIET